MTTETAFRRAYNARFNRVLDHIDRHLADELRLEQLADIALFSPFHFHRLFLHWQGETLADYVRRRRLQLAAGRLQNNRELSVLAIALDCGFASGESFARAFRQYFGCSPTAWRKRRPLGRSKPGQVHSKIGLAQGKQGQILPRVYVQDDALARPMVAGSACEEMMMKKNALMVTVSQLPAVRIAYMRRTGPYGSGVGELWEHFKKWCAARGLLEGHMLFGLFLDDPDISGPEHCRYDVAVEVDAAFVPEGEVAVRDLPGGLYALLDFFGDQPAVGEAWEALISDWLPDSGYQMDDRPCFERYPANARYEPETGSFSCQIVVAVRPL